jgi:hypothetical protein
MKAKLLPALLLLLVLTACGKNLTVKEMQDLCENAPRADLVEEVTLSGYAVLAKKDGDKYAVAMADNPNDQGGTSVDFPSEQVEFTNETNFRIKTHNGSYVAWKEKIGIKGNYYRRKYPEYTICGSLALDSWKE